jgi:hypothetical protein
VELAVLKVLAELPVSFQAEGIREPLEVLEMLDLLDLLEILVQGLEQATPG